MSYVVTGATGHLGGLVVDGLLAAGVAPTEIVAAGRDQERLAGLAARGVRVATVDFEDPATLAGLIGPGDVVLLVSGPVPGNRVALHKNLVDAAVAGGAARLVYTSAPQADTSALVLAPEHKATEELVRASGVPFTILRNGWYNENYVQAAQQARETGTLAASVGDGRIASASRVDYADAAVVVMTQDGHEGTVYELSGDDSWDYDTLAAAIGDVVGRDVTYQRLSPDEHRALLLGAGLDAGTVEFVVALDGNTRDGLLAETSGDLGRLIGRPTTPLVDGLRRAVADAG